MKGGKKGEKRSDRNKVHKPVSDVTSIPKVDWQVQKVVCALVIGVNLVEQHLLVILIGDVSDHDCCSGVIADFQPVVMGWMEEGGREGGKEGGRDGREM